MNKLKIINDPVYGLVEIPFELIYDLIEHPTFQRLRRISQLGLTGLVYPGALHTRFQHAIGAMHLIQRAIATLKSKGVQISEQEHEAVSAAILLHDIGHGPYSHALENSLIGVGHEALSIAMMIDLNKQFEGKLDLAIEIFRNHYHRPFFHQLISGQVDVDRLDYLRRDSFYTGVSEGTIGIDRILQMLQVKNDKLVVEEKGLYSIENFIMARRLMYWQVYFHKTVIAAESLLINILKRAKFLANQGVQLFSTVTMNYFLYHDVTAEMLRANPEILTKFGKLDDFDLMASIKDWEYADDKVLARLCRNLAMRNLPKVLLQDQPFEEQVVYEKIRTWCDETGFSEEEAKYFIYTDAITIQEYSAQDEIMVLLKNGSVIPYSQASNTTDKAVIKYYLCYNIS